MASSDDLRRNKEQHKAKNILSKGDDKEIYIAMQMCIKYLKKRLDKYLQNHELRYQKSISYKQIIDTIKRKGLRNEFDMVFMERTIKPDGGIITLHNKNSPDEAKIVLISEVKRQGTNKLRVAEGKPIQAQGNAIERLGKNLIGIKAMMNHEKITPFVCFGWGSDFIENYGNDFVMSKLSMLNEFYKLNQIYVFKRDGDSDKNHFSPVSMYFREKKWTAQEMFEILKEVGENALRYYLH